MSTASSTVPGIPRPANYAAMFSEPFTSQFVKYNYLDTVDVSWITWATNSTPISLQFWFYEPDTSSMASFDPQSSDVQFRTLGQSEIVAGNGSKQFRLNQSNNTGSGYYLGRWTLDFLRSDSNPPSGFTQSGTFQCTFNNSAPARTWSYGTPQEGIATADPVFVTTDAASGASSTASAATSSATSVAVSTTTSANTAVPSVGNSTSASSTQATLPSGVIAAIAVLSVLLVAGLSIVAFFLLSRQRRRAQAGISRAVHQSSTEQEQNHDIKVEGNHHLVFNTEVAKTQHDSVEVHEVVGSQVETVELPEESNQLVELSGEGRR